MIMQQNQPGKVVVSAMTQQGHPTTQAREVTLNSHRQSNPTLRAPWRLKGVFPLKCSPRRKGREKKRGRYGDIRGHQLGGAFHNLLGSLYLHIPRNHQLGPSDKCKSSHQQGAIWAAKAHAGSRLTQPYRLTSASDLMISVHHKGGALSRLPLNLSQRCHALALLR